MLGRRGIRATRIGTFGLTRRIFGGVTPRAHRREPESRGSAEVVAGGARLAVHATGMPTVWGHDRRGDFVSSHRVSPSLLLHAFRRRGLTGRHRPDVLDSILIDRVAARLGVPLYETPIGFKYVADLMNRGEAAAGGEESGGYAFAFHLPERDGVFNGLLLLESLAQSGRDLDGALADLAAEFGRFAYGRRDVYLPVPVVANYLRAVERDPPQVGASR